MHLHNLNVDLHTIIINHLDITDLAYLSLVNKYYSALLSDYRIFGKYNSIATEQTLKLLLPEDTMYYGHFGYSNEIEELMILLNNHSLAKIMNGIYCFKQVMFGIESFDKLHHYISQYTRCDLKVSASASGFIHWGAIQPTALGAIVALNISKESELSIAIPLIKFMINLKDLNLTGEFNTSTWTVLSELLPKSNVRDLSITQNNSISTNIQIFVNAIAMSNIKKLSVLKCSAQNTVAEAIAVMLPESNLVSLNLSENSITDLGLTALHKALPTCNLESISLESNSFTDSGLKSLSHALSNSRIKAFQFDRMIGYFDYYKSSKLEKLHVRKITLDIENILIETLPFSNLQELRVFESFQNLEGFMSILSHSSVKYLQVSIEKDLDNGINIIAQHINNSLVEKLEIYNCTAFDEMIDDSEIEVGNITLLLQNINQNKRIKSVGFINIAFDRTLSTLTNILVNKSLEYLCLPVNIFDWAIMENFTRVISQNEILVVKISIFGEFSIDAVTNLVRRVKDSKLKTLKFPNRLSAKNKREIREILGDWSKLQVEYY
ncbi:hypothetical protein HDV06_005673 [Boothiomyces sp. JEL0866]|nr:hypothetical protein HDV06_005673 [Boothiomyces sp. JEL0866]